MNREFIPFWEKEIIENETVFFIEKDGIRSANLLFDVRKIISFTDYNGRVFYEGKDFYLKGRRLTAQSEDIPFMKEQWLKFEDVPDFIENENKNYNIKGCLLCSPLYMRKYFCYVTYKKGSGDKLISFTEQNINLPLTYERLTTDGKLDIVLFGDSISNAANSSFQMGISGAEPAWYDRLRENIAFYYGADVTLKNFSRSGYGTEWAREVAKEKFSNQQADLVIIAFGMNDGAGGMTQQRYKENLEAVISDIDACAANRDGKATEYIFIATPLPNPECKQINLTQSELVNALRDFNKTGVSIVNMTALYEWLLKSKNYCEISGNNLNHPNDFGYRFYSDGLTEIL